MRTGFFKARFYKQKHPSVRVSVPNGFVFYSFFMVSSYHKNTAVCRSFWGQKRENRGQKKEIRGRRAAQKRHKSGSLRFPGIYRQPRAFAAPKDPPRNKFTRLPQNDRFCVSADRISPSFCAENLPVFSRAGKNPFLAPIPLFADRFPARRSPAGLLCALPHPRFCPSKQKKPARCRFSAACRTPPKEYFC